jgi:hypothetical protein
MEGGSRCDKVAYIEVKGGGTPKMPPNVPPIYVSVALKIDTAEMEQRASPSPFNGYLNRPMVPYALQEIGMPDSGERALRTEGYHDLSVKAGGPGESSLDTRMTEIKGEGPDAVQVNPI